MKTDTLWVVKDGGWWSVSVRKSKFNPWDWVAYVKDYQLALKVAKLAKEG